jgi:putative transcriptional regulator
MVLKRLEEIGERVRQLLRSYGFSVDVLSYPSDPSRRSIDVLAARENGISLFLKVTDDVAELPASEIRELRRASSVLDAKPLVVAEREAGRELDEIAAYERVGVYTVTSEGLRRVIEERVYVVRRQGRFYMRVDGEKLREIRERRGYSLGDVANLLGVSRRSVYMYEKGVTDIALEKALRLLEVFGEEVFKPIGILSDSNYPSPENPQARFDVREEEEVARILRAAGGRVVHMKHTAADLAASLGDHRSVILVEHGKHDDIEARSEEAIKLGRASGAELYAIVRSRSYVTDLEEQGYTVFHSAADLVKELKQIGLLGHHH